MVKFLNRLFGQAQGKTAPKVLGKQSYNEFEIRATPIKEPNGWRIAGSLVKQIDGVEQTYEFIRADICSDQDSAVEISLRKGRRLVDEQGEKVFKRS